MKTLSVNLSVLFVPEKGKPQKAVIVEVITPTSAKLELGKNSHALASFDAEKSVGTFHFPDGDAVDTPPQAEAPATNNGAAAAKSAAK